MVGLEDTLIHLFIKSCPWNEGEHERRTSHSTANFAAREQLGIRKRCNVVLDFSTLGLVGLRTERTRKLEKKTAPKERCRSRIENPTGRVSLRSTRLIKRLRCIRKRKFMLSLRCCASDALQDPTLLENAGGCCRTATVHDCEVQDTVAAQKLDRAA